VKNIIKTISLLVLVCFSFFYTDKVMNIINQKDPLMIKIESLKEEYEVEPVNAMLDQDTIIPGINGRQIDVLKSYEEMKSSGIFREELLVYKDLYPSSLLSNNKDKYIIKGNNKENKVSLILILNIKDIDNIKDNNITLFINHKDINIKNITKLKNKEIYTYGNNGIYTNELLTNDNSIINRISNNESKYCLSKNKDNTVLEVCNKNNMYTIVPNIIGDYTEIKNNISNGSIILINNTNNLNIIIKYINSKGYNIVPLSNLLKE